MSPEHTTYSKLYARKIATDPGVSESLDEIYDERYNVDMFPVIKEELLENKVAVAASRYDYQFHHLYPCKIVDLKGDYMGQWLPITVTKDSDLLPLVNHFILRMFQSGEMERIRRINKAKMPQRECQEEDNSLSYDTVASLFIIVPVGLAVSLLGLASEWSQKQRRTR